MLEASNPDIEFAHRLSEYTVHFQSFAEQTVEIAEALVLAIVAMATAWSGYQAALWTGHQAERYGEASKLRVQAEGIQNVADQERLYLAATVVEWLKAEARGDKNLADLFERRLLPEFRPAFEAWKKTDPIHKASALPGPQLMPEYRNSEAEAGGRVNNEAAEVFAQGNEARARSDDYVRITVILATILLFTAVGQRFKAQRVREAVLAFSMLLLCFPIYLVIQLPRA
jgi:hypothetical protein